MSFAQQTSAFFDELTAILDKKKRSIDQSLGADGRLNNSSLIHDEIQERIPEAQPEPDVYMG